MNKKEFIRKLYNKSYIEKMLIKSKLLGVNNQIDIYDMILFRLISSLIVFILILYNFSYGYILAPLCTFIYYNIFNKITLTDKLTKRTNELEKDAMHFFEVLTLSLETGRNLSSAIEVTISNVECKLSDEFREAIRQVSFGKSLTEALTDMQERIPSESVNNIILSLTQANLYGNSIIENLYLQIDYLREKRKMEVKGKISKVPVLISVISVLFFIPLLLILILGPILLGYLS